MRELIEYNDFCGVTYRRSVFVDYDGFVINTTAWTPVAGSNSGRSTIVKDLGSSYVGGVCGNNLGGILIR